MKSSRVSVRLSLFITLFIFTSVGASSVFFLPKMASQLSRPCFDNDLERIASPVISFFVAIVTPVLAATKLAGFLGLNSLLQLHVLPPYNQDRNIYESYRLPSLLVLIY